MSMTLNNIKTNTMAPYINSQIEQSLNRAFRSETNFSFDDICLYFQDLGGSSNRPIPETSHADGAVNVFHTNVVPAFRNTSNSSIWSAGIIALATETFGIIKYSGAKTQVEVNLLYIGDTASHTDELKVQLYINGADIEANYTGGRGYQYDTTAYISDSDGNGALLKVVVNSAGKITAINVLKGGANYSGSAKVVIEGTGIGATATPTIVANKITAITLGTEKICEDGLSLQYTPAAGKKNGGQRNYIFTLMPGDTIDARVISLKSGSSDINTCIVYQVKLQVKKANVKLRQ